MALTQTFESPIVTPPAIVNLAPETDRPPALPEIVASLGVESDWVWAWKNYKQVVRSLSQQLDAKRLIEIGAGRGPLFDLDELNDLKAELTVNDISPRELAHLSDGYKTACFDVAGDISGIGQLHNSFDLAFSRMVFEHVADGQRAWANLHDLLAPGGIALAFIPTLYSLPFVLNWLLPDRMAAALVRTFRPDRNYDKAPVFPARYSRCFAAEAPMVAMLSAIGYREVTVLPFYGHSYYGVFPIIRDLHQTFTAIARRRDWRTLASFAYIIARK